jgi:hypothetical protein
MSNRGAHRSFRDRAASSLVMRDRRDQPNESARSNYTAARVEGECEGRLQGRRGEYAAPFKAPAVAICEGEVGSE